MINITKDTGFKSGDILIPYALQCSFCHESLDGEKSMSY